MIRVKTSYLRIFSLFITVGFLLSCSISLIYSLKNHYFINSLYYTALIVSRDLLNAGLIVEITVFLLTILVCILLSRIGKRENSGLLPTVFLVMLVLFVFIFGGYNLNTMDVFPPLLSFLGIASNAIFASSVILLGVFLFFIRDRIRKYIVSPAGAFSFLNIVCLVLLLVILLLNASIYHLRRGNRTDRPSVLLVSLDTLRSDHLGCYGYDIPTSPFLDSFADEAVLFSNAFSQSSWTLPAHMSLFTSQYPMEHGANVRKQSQRTSKRRGVMLAELLRNEFFTSAAYTGGGFLGANFGFQKGFDIYSDTPLEYRNLFDAGSLRFIEKNASQPFFLFLHTYCIHNYQTSPDILKRFDPACTGKLNEWEDIKSYIYLFQHAELGEEDAVQVRHIEKVYDASIRYMDNEIEKLFTYLKELDIYDDLLIIIISDHGEEFGEHGHTSHGHSLHDELIKVPLIIRFPHGEWGGTRVEEPVSLIDVMPTVLDYLGIEGPRGMRGKSLIPRPEGEDSRERPVFSDLRTDILEFSLRTSRYHLIYKTVEKGLAGGIDGRYLLYDVVSDPGESCDVAQMDSVLTSSLKKDLLEWLRRTESFSGRKGGQVNNDTKLEKDLKALGYIQ